MDRFCEDNGFITWFSTSAKEDRNIREAVDALIQAILAREAPPSHQKKGGMLDLTAPPKPEPQKPCAC
jgi:hypothetical protein